MPVGNGRRSEQELIIPAFPTTSNVFTPSNPRAHRPVEYQLFRLVVPGVILAVVILGSGYLLQARSGKQDITILGVAALSVLGLWTILYMVGSSESLDRRVETVLLWDVERRRINAWENATLAHIDAVKATNLSLSDVSIAKEEAIVASTARTVMLSPGEEKREKSLKKLSRVDAKAVRAVCTAYDLAQELDLVRVRKVTYLPNNARVPFSARSVGADYAAVRDRLCNPGSRDNRKIASVAWEDKDRRQWAINTKDYPTKRQAVFALTGIEVEENVVVTDLREDTDGAS